MKGKFILSAALALTAGLPLMSQTPADIVAQLRRDGCYGARAEMRVSLPQNADDVVYDVTLTQGPAAPGDTLSAVNYLIDWTYRNAPGGASRGFAAYFDGNHYRLSGNRLQEYHAAADAGPFLQGRSSVQRSAQCAWLLPAMIADEIAAMAADPRYTLNVIPDRCGTVSLDAVMNIDGETSMSRSYTFDRNTMRPLTIATESNPGAISEQSLSVSYFYNDSIAACPPADENALMALYPATFERLRSSSFRLDNLPGLEMPAFSLPDGEGNRHTHARGERFDAPSLFVLLDPAGVFSPDVVRAVRKAVDALPYSADIYWALTGTSPVAAEDLLGTLLPGEHLLLNAASLARDTGAAALPAIIAADSRGTVRFATSGFNKDIAGVVTQQMTLLQ